MHMGMGGKTRPVAADKVGGQMGNGQGSSCMGGSGQWGRRLGVGRGGQERRPTGGRRGRRADREFRFTAESYEVDARFS